MNETGYVYLIADENEQFCKIGVSKNPRTRFRSIQPNSPLKLKLLHSSRVENRRAAEEVIHYRLRAHRLHNEWFKISPKEALLEIGKVLSDPDALSLRKRYKIPYIDSLIES